MKKGEEMNVTRQTLRDMILAEAGEIELANPDPFRGLAKPILATLESLFPEDETLSYEQEQERIRQKLATAKFITDLSTLTGMDDMEIQLFVPDLVNIDKKALATLGDDIKALAESGQLTTTRLRQLISEVASPSGHDTTLMTVGQFRRLVREAATAGSSREAASNDVGALFARILKVEDEEQKNDLLNRLDNAGQDIGQRDEIAAELLDIEEPVSDFIHPAEDQHRSMERLEQLRKESDDILKKLLSSMSSEIILLKLRRLVYNDDSSRKRLAKWMEDQAMGIPDDALLKNWLDEIGPEEAYDDLAELEDKLMKGSSMEERINRGIDSLKQ